MAVKFKVDTDYYDRKEKIYQYRELSFEPGVTVLVGCNGAGKTTLLRQIEQQCKQKKYPVLQIDNRTEGGNNAMQKALLSGDFTLLCSQATSSEGENILLNIGTWAGEIGRFIRDNKAKKKPIIVLFDAIDSGLSLDNMIEIKRDLLHFIVDHEKDSEVYLIITSNSYEFCRNEKCINVVTGVKKTYKNYEEYRKEIIQTRQLKDKRYKRTIFKDT